MKWKVPLCDLNYGPEEEAAVKRVLASRWLSMGPEVEAFEAEFAEFIGSKYAVAVSSATAALHLIMLALDIGERAEVVQPDLNFVATANMTRQVGASPVFADIVSVLEPTLDPASAEAAITDRTKALVVMAYGGMAPRMQELADLCAARNIALIEDACHAPGVFAPDGQGGSKKIGAWGDAAAFSFFSNKNLATGEGGMITTNRADIAERCRRLRSHGMTRLTYERHTSTSGGYDVTESGLNYRMDELRAALGRVQLSKLISANAKRATAATYYDQLIGEKLEAAASPTIEVPLLPVIKNREFTSAHIYPVLIKDAGQNRTKADIGKILGEQGIQTSFHYPPVSSFSAFTGDRNAGGSATLCPITREFATKELTLPLWPDIIREQQKMVVEELFQALS